MCIYAAANVQSVLPHMQVTFYARCMCNLNRIQLDNFCNLTPFSAITLLFGPTSTQIYASHEGTDGLPAIERDYLSFRGGAGVGKVAVLISMLLMNTTCRQT
jgi:hypothetical protein